MAASERHQHGAAFPCCGFVCRGWRVAPGVSARGRPVLTRSAWSAVARIAALDRRVLDAAGAWLARQRWWRAVRDFPVDLRPAWWVARGWAFWEFARPSRDASGHVLPTSAASLAVLTVFVVASVQVGRRSVGVRNGWRLVIGAVNVLAVLFLLAGLTVVTAEPEPLDGASPVPASVATP